MVTSLFKYERIRTTDVKAKELRRWADNMITLAKRGDLHARRQALAIIREKAVVHKLFEEAPERYGNINGGYTRVVKLARRPGDAAPISMIELVVAEKDRKKTKKKTKTEDLVEPKVGETSLPEAPVAQEETKETIEAAEVSEASSSDEERAEPPAEDAATDEADSEETNTEASTEVSTDSTDSKVTEPEK